MISDYGIRRQVDVESGLSFALLDMTREANEDDRVRRVCDALGAVAPERRLALAEAFVAAAAQWRAAIGTDGQRAAYQRMKAVRDDAIHAQIAGTIFHFGGAR